jgi:hypothetical protein
VRLLSRRGRTRDFGELCKDRCEITVDPDLGWVLVLDATVREGLISSQEDVGAIPQVS